MDYQIIQWNIGSLLKINGMKQTELADKLGVDIGTVNRWVRGKNGKPIKIPRPQLENIAAAFGISYDALIDPQVFSREVNGLDFELFGDLCALEDYLKGIGVKIDYEYSEETPIGLYSHFAIPSEIIFTWHNDKHKSISKRINYLTFKSFARRMKEHALIEIKHL